MLAAYNSSSTSLVVVWERIDASSIPGLLRSYRVYYGKGELNLTTATHIDVGADTLTLPIHGLEKWTNYTVQVTGVTKYESPASSPVFARTAEDGT